MGFACIQGARSSPQRPSGSFHGSSSSFVTPICNIDSIQILTVSPLNEKKLDIGNASIVRKLVFRYDTKGGHAAYSGFLSNSFLPSETSVPLILSHYVQLMTFGSLI